MKRNILLLGVLAFFTITALTVVDAVQAAEHAKMSKVSYTQSAVNLRMAMRKLWEDHITYTRNYIISALADLGDTGKVAERLLKNQDDIGDALKPVYGDETGRKLSALLRDHILIAAGIVKAAKVGDGEAVTKGQRQWHQNADDIAAFLSTANPNWSKPMLTDMLYKHLDFTTAEVVSRLKKDWVADMEAYDRGHEHMLMFADVLTAGVIEQFPNKFRA